MNLSQTEKRVRVRLKQMSKAVAVVRAPKFSLSKVSSQSCRCRRVGAVMGKGLSVRDYVSGLTLHSGQSLFSAGARRDRRPRLVEANALKNTGSSSSSQSVASGS